MITFGLVLEEPEDPGLSKNTVPARLERKRFVE
jgi:hypothetical protein